MRKKNALRQHYVAKPVEEDKEPEYVRLAKWITTITDDSDENTDDQGFYDGDGSPETTVISIAEKWNFEGTFDNEDPAQSLIASLKRKTGNDRKLMHRIVETNGDTVEGIATASGIKAGSGEAVEFEEFACVLNYDKTPAVKPSEKPTPPPEEKSKSTGK